MRTKKVSFAELDTMEEKAEFIYALIRVLRSLNCLSNGMKHLDFSIEEDLDTVLSMLSNMVEEIQHYLYSIDPSFDEDCEDDDEYTLEEE